jgi:hypothetical protein
MSDIIYYKNGEKTFRISPPTVGTKCPETKLEVKKMNEIEKTEGEIKVLQAKLELLKEIETHKSQPKMEFDFGGKFEIVSYNDKEYLRLEFTDESHGWYKRKHTVDGVVMVSITDGETRRLLEGVWFNDVKKGKYDDVTTAEPYKNVRAYWGEKDNPKPMDEVVDKLIKEQQAQKLYNRLYDELGYEFDTCNEIVDLVEDWLPTEHDTNSYKWNECIRMIREKLR